MRLKGFDFVERVLDVLGTSYSLNPREREHIPVDGPLLVVANHPLGMKDALALLQLIGSVRRDVRILGNDWLAVDSAIAQAAVAGDVFGKGAASRLRDIYRALDNGEALIVFPLAKCRACARWRARRSLVRWLCATGAAQQAPVLPIHVAARNSAMFYGLSMLAKPLSTAMLPREAVAPASGGSVSASVSSCQREELEQRSGGSPSRPPS